MIVFKYFVVIFVAAATLAGPGHGDVAEIEAVLARLSADSMQADVERLVAFETRFMGSDSNRAAVEWLVERFEGMGYAATRDSFVVNVDRTVSGKTYVLNDLTQVNVVASREGLLTPKRKLVIGAHYDSISLDREQVDQDVAPGADDNATGVAAVLEMARLLKDTRTSSTVEFVLFGSEELGLIGSGAHADVALEAGDDIVLMIGMDILGTRSTTFADAFTIDTSSRNLSIAEDVADAAEQFTSVFSRDGGSGSRIRVTASGCRCSDHQSYLDRGFPAIGVFQFFTNPSPHINMSTDTIDKVDIGYAGEITRAALAGALRVAGFPSRTADFDGDGEVTFADFLLFGDVFGLIVSDPAHDPFDLDGDGVVGFTDFLIFAENFGRVIA